MVFLWFSYVPGHLWILVVWKCSYKILWIAMVFCSSFQELAARRPEDPLKTHKIPTITQRTSPFPWFPCGKRTPSIFHLVFDGFSMKPWKLQCESCWAAKSSSIPTLPKTADGRICLPASYRWQQQRFQSARLAVLKCRRTTGGRSSHVQNHF